MMSVTVRKSDFSSFEAMKFAVQDAPLDIMQIGLGGQMTGSLLHLSFNDSVAISTGDFSRGLRARGVMSERRVGLVTIFEAPAVMQDFELAPGDILRVAPKEEIYVSHLQANRYGVTLVTPEYLAEVLNSLQPGAADKDIWRMPDALLAAGDPEAAAVRLSQLRMLYEDIARDGSDMTPEVSDYFARRALRLKLAPALAHTAGRYRGPHLRSSVRIVGKAEDFIASVAPRPVDISELCAVLNMSERSLNRAFHDVHKLPPMKYLNRKRLSALHSALKQAAGEPDAVNRIGRIALQHGYAQNDHGRLARDFRKVFGELPRDTLRHG